MGRGRISLQFTVWCGCGYRAYAPSAIKGRREAVLWAKSNGWRYSQEAGYVCPNCKVRTDKAKEVLGNEQTPPDLYCMASATSL